VKCRNKEGVNMDFAIRCLLACGFCVKEIAAIAHKSPKTIEYYLHEASKRFKMTREVHFRERVNGRA
jgi:DNA-binding NarL/FixJ family response regulator